MIVDCLISLAWQSQLEELRWARQSSEGRSRTVSGFGQTMVNPVSVCVCVKGMSVCVGGWSEWVCVWVEWVDGCNKWWS